MLPVAPVSGVERARCEPGEVHRLGFTTKLWRPPCGEARVAEGASAHQRSASLLSYDAKSVLQTVAIPPGFIGLFAALRVSTASL